MTASLTIYPLASGSSPALAGKAKAPDIVNDDFFSSFADILDVINPLQHIPVLSNLYRDVTGDKISTGASLLGGTIFGGALGFMASLANSIVEQETGGTVSSHLLAMVTDKYQQTQALS